MNITIFYRGLYKTALLVFFIQSLLLSQGYTFRHTATAGNSIANYTIIDFGPLN